jgi:hypothetical protein
LAEVTHFDTVFVKVKVVSEGALTTLPSGVYVFAVGKPRGIGNFDTLVLLKRIANVAGVAFPIVRVLAEGIVLHAHSIV